MGFLKKLFGSKEKKNKSNEDNIWRLYIRSNGSYYCYRCSCGGGFSDLKKKISKYRNDNESRDNIFSSLVCLATFLVPIVNFLEL
jgi:hypothetical protein